MQVVVRVRPNSESIEIGHRARSRTARVATRPTSAGRGRGFPRRASGRHCKNRKLRSQMFALALGTGCLLAPKNQSFELMLAFGANVFKYRHVVSSAPLSRQI